MILSLSIEDILSETQSYSTHESNVDTGSPTKNH